MEKQFYDAGVYAVRSKKTGSLYVGASCFLPERLGEHLRCIVSGKHNLKTLRSIFKDHTAADVEFEVLERVEVECDPTNTRGFSWDKLSKPGLEILNEREGVWIRKLGAANVKKRQPRIGVDVEVIDRTAVA